jgi:hypothetical protein
MVAKEYIRIMLNRTGVKKPQQIRQYIPVFFPSINSKSSQMLFKPAEAYNTYYFMRS